MVERLREAIEKARQRRDGAVPAQTGAAAPEPPEARPPAQILDALPELLPDPGHLRRHRIVSLDRSDPAHVAFDMLRTRLLKVCRDNGWKRIGITSPGKGNGKTTICVNLAFSLARQAGLRVLLLDLDLRHPSVATVLGAPASISMGDFLSGAAPVGDVFRRVDADLVVALGSGKVRDSAELLQSADAVQRLDEAIEALRPDIVLYDLPPVLAGDDMIGFLPNLDALMMIVAAGQTKPAELEEAERLIGGATNFLGVTLNRFGDSTSEYQYAY